MELQAYSNGYQKRLNREAWLFGIYVQDAVAACLSAAFAKKGSTNVFKYPERPHESLQPTDQKEQETSKKKEETERLQAKLYMHQMMWAYKDWKPQGGELHG